VRIGARTRLDEGHLHVAMAPGMTRGAMLRVLGRAVVGRLMAVDHLDVLLTREVTIAAWRRRLPVALDGEVTLLRTPLRYRVRPGALQVRIPGGGYEVTAVRPTGDAERERATENE
jgi:diacylglycerol kinase family enzyme